jgi:hypothetical protein
MSDLAKNTPPEELASIASIIKGNPEPTICSSRKDFSTKMLARISGTGNMLPLVIKNHDVLSGEEIFTYRTKAESENRLFVLPSIVKPVSKTEKDDFYPHIVFFTHDYKLFMMPYTGSEFSDMYDFEYVDEDYEYYDDYEYDE